MSPKKRTETFEETYISNGLVDIVESVTQRNNVQDIVSQKSKVGRLRKTNLTNKQVVENELVVDGHDLVSQKSKVGRPRKIGKAQEINDIIDKKNHQKVGKTVGKLSTENQKIVNTHFIEYEL